MTIRLQWTNLQFPSMRRSVVFTSNSVIFCISWTFNSFLGSSKRANWLYMMDTLPHCFYKSIDCEKYTEDFAVFCVFLKGIIRLAYHRSSWAYLFSFSYVIFITLSPHRMEIWVASLPRSVGVLRWNHPTSTYSRLTDVFFVPQSGDMGEGHRYRLWVSI